MLEDLAIAVRSARTRLELEEISARGGPSAGLLRRLAQYRAGDEPWPLRPATLAALDVGLGWEAGTAVRLLEQPAGVDVEMPAVLERLAVLEAKVDGLVELVEGVSAMLRRWNRGRAARLAAAINELREVVERGPG